MKRSIPLIFLLLLSFLTTKAQDGQCLSTATNAEIVCVTETMPYLLLKTEGAATVDDHRKQTNQLLLQFIYSHFRYPPINRDRCVSGTVVVSFTIGTDGLIDQESIRCVRDIGGGCGAEIERIIRLMADLGWRWVPGKQGGIPVPVRYNIPVKICLE